jgi:hypothetical protein
MVVPTAPVTGLTGETSIFREPPLLNSSHDAAYDESADRDGTRKQSPSSKDRQSPWDGKYVTANRNSEIECEREGSSDGTQNQQVCQGYKNPESVHID